MAAVVGQSRDHRERETGVSSCQGFLISVGSHDHTLQALESEGVTAPFTEIGGSRGRGTWDSVLAVSAVLLWED